MSIGGRAFLLRRETTNQILRRFGRSVRPRLIGAIAILVSYALFLPRNPLPQGAGSTFAPAKVSPLSGFTENAKVESPQSIGDGHGKTRRVSVWHRCLSRVRSCHRLRHRLRYRSGGAENDRLRARGSARGIHRYQSRAVDDFRPAAQRHGAAAIQEMVDDDRPEICRAQHLRAARQPRARARVLAVAADSRRGVGGQRSPRLPRHFCISDCSAGCWSSSARS